MKKHAERMVPDTFYHVYNRACGFERIFTDPSNYDYFMDSFEERLTGYVDLYCYCLIPNHFHMLIKTKTYSQLGDIEVNFSKHFSNFFASYAQSYNKFYNRKGSLFSQNFRRKQIENENYLKTVVIYIHRNPLKHGLVSHLNDWKYSSYQEFVHSIPRYCTTKYPVEWFGSIDIFKFCHNLNSEIDIE